MPGEQSVVERILRETWGRDVVLEDGVALHGRDYVHRFHVHGTPTSVIVKQVDDSNERTCLELLTKLSAEPPAPRLYAANETLLIMEDFGDGERLDHALLGKDPERATQTLVALMETIGTMHAVTRRLGNAPAPREPPITSGLAALELRPHASFFDEFAEIRGRAELPEFQALIHGDPCPDNCQWVGDRVRLLDFEHGRFGNIFSDASYPLVPFPTCWCLGRLPERVVVQALAAYSRATGIDDQTLTRGVTEATIMWTWSMFAGWHMPKVLSKDDQWGRATVRQRILFRFRHVIEILQRHGWYPAVADTSRRSLELLSSRWGDVPDVPLYPAFQ
jgi:hypothetical protein